MTSGDVERWQVAAIATNRAQQRVFDLYQLWNWKSFELKLNYSKLL